MKKWLAQLRRFSRAHEGLASLEFAMASPILLALFLGGVQMSHYILLTQKIDKVAYTVADLVGQNETISKSDLNQILIASQEILNPYPFNTNGVVIISSVTKNGTSTPTINWQYSGGGTLVKTSQIGQAGQNATLPGTFTMVDKDNIIIAEVFYTYAPLVKTNFLSNNMYKRAVYKPRLGALGTLLNN